MIKKFLLSLTAVALTCSSAFAAMTKTQDGITYTVTGGTPPVLNVEITKCDASLSGEVTIPDHIVFGGNMFAKPTSIANQAFAQCANITKVSMPTSITQIGDSAFFKCTKLESVNIPENVEKIGDCTFAMCSAMKAITLPSTVKTIGNAAFIKSGLTALTTPDALESIGKKAFAGCDALKELNFNNGLKTIDAGAFISCTGITELVIPEGCETIGANAFISCTALKTLDIASSANEIGANAFANNEALTSITARATTPAVVEDLFSTSIYNTAVLNVPQEALAAYKAAAVWKEFKNIKAILSTGINTVNAEPAANDANAPYYNLNGVRVSNPQNGIFIHNGKKVLIK